MVTIVIVAALAAITLAVTGKMRKKAAKVTAINALRDVASANAGYSTENFGNINTLKWAGDPEEGRPFVGNSFWGRFQEFLFVGATATNQKKLKEQINQGLDQMFNTSDADTMTGTAFKGTKVYHDSSGLPVPIGFNSKLYQWGNFVKLSQLKDPGNTIYAAYGFGMFDQADGQSYVEMRTDGSKPDCNIHYFDDKKALVAYLDGRVEFVSPPMPDRKFGDPD